jgi:hypothetical protein
MSQGHKLRYPTTNRAGSYKYASEPAVCSGCEMLGECTEAISRIRVITCRVRRKYQE